MCVISNVGDNYWVYGMYVCPDIDTMVYGLADLLDSKRSWGIKNDSFNFLRQMEVFGEETWFRMGDRDAATNLMRTNMLKDGKNLGFITDWLCKKFAVGTKIIPMTDNNVETRITTPKGEMHLQEFWVKHRGKEKVQGIRYVGIEKARPNPEAINAIQNASMVVLAPGNPLTSIGPMLELKGLYKELTKAKKKTVAVSPFIGTDAISGPAAEYMKAAGIEPSALGLSRMYSSVCGHMIIRYAEWKNPHGERPNRTEFLCMVQVGRKAKYRENKRRVTPSTPDFFISLHWCFLYKSLHYSHMCHRIGRSFA